MITQKFFTVVVKIVAIYFLIQAVESLLFVVPVFSSDETASYAFTYLGLVVFYILAAIVLFKWSEPFGARLAGKSKDDKIGFQVTATELQELVLLAVGVFLLVSALSSLTNTVAVIISQKLALKEMFKGIGSDLWGNLISSSLKFILGFYLTFGFRGVSNFIKKLKEA